MLNTKRLLGLILLIPTCVSFAGAKSCVTVFKRAPLVASVLLPLVTTDVASHPLDEDLRSLLAQTHDGVLRTILEDRPSLGPPSVNAEVRDCEVKLTTSARSSDPADHVEIERSFSLADVNLRQLITRYGKFDDEQDLWIVAGGPGVHFLQRSRAMDEAWNVEQDRKFSFLHLRVQNETVAKDLQRTLINAVQECKER